MAAQALEWLDIQPNDRVLDLFCGMGQLYPAAVVLGIEGIATLVANGQYNAHKNKLNNAPFFPSMKIWKRTLSGNLGQHKDLIK